MTDPRQTADPEICAHWDWCPYCKNGLDTGLQCDQCLADLMPVQEALRELQRLRSAPGASGCGHVPAGYSCVTPGCSNGPAPESSAEHEALAADLQDRIKTATTFDDKSITVPVGRARMIISALRSVSPEPREKPVQILGLCNKHQHIGHFPAEVPTLPVVPIETVCPWCVRATSTKEVKP